MSGQRLGIVGGSGERDGNEEAERGGENFLEHECLPVGGCDGRGCGWTRWRVEPTYRR